MSIENEKIISVISSGEVFKDLLEQTNGIMSGDSAMDTMTGDHCVETAKLVVQVALKFDISSEFLDVMTLGSLLHDIGKSEIPANVLNGSKKLSEDEMRLMSTHPVTGAVRIRELAERDLNSCNPFFHRWQWDLVIALTALHHTYKARKEQCYPSSEVLEGLSNSNIIQSESLSLVEAEGYGEMLAICDVFSAISASRAYSKGRLASERLDDPSNKSSATAKAEAIGAVVEYELKLSKMGAVALNYLTDYYAFTLASDRNDKK